MISDNPRDIGVPHDEWRKGQRESIEWLCDEQQTSTRIVEACTGSGKSSLSKALAYQHRTLVCTKTRSLQEAYRDVYSADILFGKSNYECVHPEAARYATANECLYKESGGMHKCPFAADCKYLYQKHKCLESKYVCLNYALWFADYARWPQPEALILDEAHLLPGLTLDHCGTQINQKQQLEWGLPDFPSIDSTSHGILTAGEDPVLPAITWLEKCITVLDKQYAKLSTRQSKHDPKSVSKARECEYFIKRLQAVIDALLAIEDGWYIKAGVGIIEYRGVMEPGFVCKPLTPRFHFPRFFLAPRKLTALMSATIGNPSALARTLGIKDYAFRVVPNQFPAEARRIYVTDDAPRMNHKSTSTDYDKQAEIIAKMLKNKDLCNPNWSGLVHTTRINEAPLLAERLAKYGLEDRIYVQPSSWGTNQRVQDWNAYRAWHSNAILITHALREGYDGLDEKICIVEKCLTPDMKVFGPDGFISMDTAKIGDRVFSLDSKGNLVVDSIRRVVRSSWNGPLYNYHSNSYSASVTANHDMLVQTDYADQSWKYTKIQADKISGERYLLPVTSSGWIGTDLPDKFSFEQFFKSDTWIWYRPRGYKRQERARIPTCFMYDGNTRLFRANYGDLPSGWKPEADATCYFSDGPRTNRVPYYWDTNDLIEFLAWFISEGHIQHTNEYMYEHVRTGESWRVAISQKLGMEWKLILDVCNRIGLKYSVFSERNSKQRLTIHSKVLYQMCLQYCGMNSATRCVPSFIMEANQSTINILFSTLMLGDGSGKAGSDRCLYYTSSSKLCEQVVEMCWKLGYRATVHRHKEANTTHNPCYDITISTKYIRGTVKVAENLSIEDYDGPVWCVETKSGTIIVSRDGRFVAVGNCPWPVVGAEGSYDNLRMHYDIELYRLSTAWDLTQAAGRTRRGRAEDYDTPTERRGFVAIVDNSYHKIKSYLPSDIQDALTTI